jgi:hypothetical protein
MSPAHDPRPASRYQAVTPSGFRDLIGSFDLTADPRHAPVRSGRVLRRIPARLLRLAPAR